MRLRLAAAAIAVTLAAALLPAGANARAVGDVQVMAMIPPPGFPALPLVLGNRIFEGTYDDPAGSSMPSRVLEYTPAGELLDSWTVAGQDLSQAHGVQVAAHDADGRLLLLDQTSGRIIRLDPRTGAQTLYGTVPELPTCLTAASGTPCSPESQQAAPYPDYAAWGPDGSLYVTDYNQGVIFRVPPGGGNAQVWLSAPQLDGGIFGTACILLMPDHHTLLFDQASNGDALSGVDNPSTGKVFEVPIEPGGKPGPIKQLWESAPAAAPDGCELSRSGDIYVAMSGPANQIVELNPQGQELAVFGQAYTGANGSSMPFDTPSGLAYYGSQLIIANQSYIAEDTSHMALLSLETGQPGEPVYVPKDAGLKPAAKAKPKRSKAKRRKRRRRKTK
jgi:hypothetical protein